MRKQLHPMQTVMWIIFRWDSMSQIWFRSILTDEIFQTCRAAEVRRNALARGREDEWCYRVIPVNIISYPEPPPKGP